VETAQKSRSDNWEVDSLDILLVDDDETLRQSLELLFTTEGYSVQVAADGEKALEQARLHYFDVVLCDVRMPGIDGLETIRQLKESVSDAHFIVMTGYASEDAPIQALRLGVDDYFTKPFDIPLFLEKLRGIARRRKSASQQSGLNLWSFVNSTKEHFRAHAERCEAVEEKCEEWGNALDLEPEDLEVMRLAAWLHPLSQGVEGANSDTEKASLEVTDRVAQLLSRVATSPSQDKLADILRAAVSVITGSGLPQGLQPELASLIKEDLTTPLDVSESSEPSHLLQVKTMGNFEVRVNGQLIERKAWQSANAKWLFVYLLSRNGQSVPEDRLAELFWPGSPPKKAHRALVSSVHRARKALNNPDLLVRYDKSYGIERGCDYWLDSEELIKHYKEGSRHFYRENKEAAVESLEAVLELYRGPYLPNCQDTWCQSLRSDIRMKVVDSAEKLAQIFLETNPSRSEQYCRKAIQLESTSEPAWSTLFRALAGQGRRCEVETAYRKCVEALQEELQLKPGISLRQAYEECLG